MNVSDQRAPDVKPGVSAEIYRFRALLWALAAAFLLFLTVSLALFAFSGGEYADPPIPIGDRIMQGVPVVAVGLPLVAILAYLSRRAYLRSHADEGSPPEA